MKIENRFLKYVSFDTQSDPYSDSTPSTLKQLDLGKYLVEELLTLGVSDAHLDEYGIVYGSIPANAKEKDAIGFIAHMDTSPDADGKDIKPQLISNYDGKAILLNKDLQIYLDPKDFPALHDVIGHDLITTDGTTLLGADDKAGVAIIMQMVETILTNPNILHGPIKIAFTPDEEVGRGADNFDVKKFDAPYAYTVDGGTIHEIGYENFNAYEAKVIIHGRSVHPGSAKNEMINAILVAMEFEQMLPVNKKPQFTEGYEGFNHLHTIQGGCDEANLTYILRDHDLSIIKEQIQIYKNICEYLNTKYGYIVCEVDFKEQYLNMYEVLKDNMRSVDKAILAMKKVGLKAKPDPIRGGTDGARLTFMGLPCPNLGTGGYNYHGRFEYVSVTMMKQGVELLLEIIKG
ncbi:MAG: peptidase T [Coprobacillaceae bacterium]